VRVRADGTIAVMYYDLRSNTADPAALPTELILARSSDAINWTESRVTDTFDLDTAPLAGGAYFLGDYQGLETAGNVFIPVYVRTTGDLQNRTDVFMLQARSIAAAALGARFTTSTAAVKPSEELLSHASENIERVMERRIPGWTRWRAGVAQPR